MCVYKVKYNGYICICAWKYIYAYIGWKWDSRIAGVTSRSEVWSDGSRAAWTLGREGEVWFTQASPSNWWVYSYHSRRQWNLLHTSSEVARLISFDPSMSKYYRSLTMSIFICRYIHIYRLRAWTWNSWTFSPQRKIEKMNCMDINCDS